MLATETNIAQWRSRFLRYIDDTRPIGDAYGSAFSQDRITPSNGHNTQGFHYESEKEAYSFDIDGNWENEIYSNCWDACRQLKVMWEASRGYNKLRRTKIAEEFGSHCKCTSRKLTNLPTTTSENFLKSLRNKNVDTTPVVQQSGIQCFNCKEFGHYAKECRKPKRVRDSTYHKEKMLLCKQAEKGVQLQAEQSDWLADTDEEIDEQELDARAIKRVKRIKESNETMTQELTVCKSILAENIDYDKLERKLNETLGLLAQKDIDIQEGLKVKAYEISVVQAKHDELVKQSLLTRSHYEGLVKEKTKVITDLKLREDKDIDKMISMEHQIKFLNEIVYKRGQSIQTIQMLAPKCSTFNGRPTFANPMYHKKAQYEHPGLYAITQDQSDPATRLIPDSEEILTLADKSRSKLNKDLVKPFDYTKLNSLYEIFKPPTQHYEIQFAQANEIRKKMWRKSFVKTKPNVFKNIDFLPVSKSVSKSRQAYNVMTNNINHLSELVNQAWVKHSNDHLYLRHPTAQDMEILVKKCLMPLALKTQDDSLAFIHELKKEMHADLKYVESLEDELMNLNLIQAGIFQHVDMLLQEVSNCLKIFDGIPKRRLTTSVVLMVTSRLVPQRQKVSDYDNPDRTDFKMFLLQQYNSFHSQQDLIHPTDNSVPQDTKLHTNIHNLHQNINSYKHSMLRNTYDQAEFSTSFLYTVKKLLSLPHAHMEAMADSAWIEAIQDELHQFDRLQVWELVDKPLASTNGVLLISYESFATVARLGWLSGSLSAYAVTQVFSNVTSMDVKTHFFNGSIEGDLDVLNGGNEILFGLQIHHPNEIADLAGCLDTPKSILEEYVPSDKLVEGCQEARTVLQCHLQRMIRRRYSASCALSLLKKRLSGSRQKIGMRCFDPAELEEYELDDLNQKRFNYRFTLTVLSALRRSAYKIQRIKKKSKNYDKELPHNLDILDLPSKDIKSIKEIVASFQD
ncbi:gag-pol polyprotein [Tanacetum coccineum]